MKQKDHFLRVILLLVTLVLTGLNDTLLAQNQVQKAALTVKSQRQITGIVVDGGNKSLAGATVLIKGTSNAAIADGKGHFTIGLPDNAKTLVVSFIGYQTKEVEVSEQSTYIVVLDEAGKMEEIVVTGIFERKANTYSGSVTTIKGEELMKVSNQNLFSALQFVDPVFQIADNNLMGSNPNALPDIQMRGASSFNDMTEQYRSSPNQPLFIVDGFEQSITKVFDMDMNRVSSITFLKDATAKAIYGSKGANGVVVIETKTPASGLLSVSYNGSVNISVPDLSSYDLTNAEEKLEIEKRAKRYDDGYPIAQQELTELYNFLLSEVRAGVDTYWLSVPLRVGVGQKHSLMFEGGNESVRYSIDVNYNNTKGVMKGSDRTTVGGGFKFSYRYKDITLKNELYTNFNKANESPYGLYSDYSKLNPYWRSHNEDGSIREVLGQYKRSNSQGKENIYNPMVNAFINTFNKNGYSDISNKFYAEWKAFKNFRLTGRFGLTSTKNDSDIFFPKDHTMFKNVLPSSAEYHKRGQYTKSNGDIFDWSMDIGANYSINFGKNQIYTNAMWQASESTANSVNMTAVGFPNNNLDYITYATQFADNSRPLGSESAVRETSVLTSLNYSWDNKYLFDANYRANASSLFGANKRWGGFYSLGGGWNIHNEQFMQDVKWVDRLKLRLSGGQTGSQQFSTYQSISMFTYYSVMYDNLIGAKIMGLANPDLRWEKTFEKNIGLDADFLKKKLSVSFDYYWRTTDDKLVPVSITPSTGFYSYTANIGSIENKGFESRIQYRILSDAKKGLNLAVFAGVLKNKNTVLSISESLNYLNSTKKGKIVSSYDHQKGDEKSRAITPPVLYVEGLSQNIIWAVKSYGIDPLDGKEMFLKKDGTLTKKWESEDMVNCGNTDPKIHGNFGFNFDYKGVQLNATFMYRLGGDYYNLTLVDKVECADVQYNVDRRMYTDRWTTEGVPSRFIGFGLSNSFTRPSSRFVQKYDELRLGSLSVSYDFKYSSIVKNKHLEQLRLSFSMNDVFRISTVKAERGLSYPFARSFSISLQTRF